MFDFWNKSSTSQKVYYVAGATTVFSCVAIVPAVFFGYGATVGMTSLLLGWTTVRAWHYTKEKTKQDLQHKIQSLKNQQLKADIEPRAKNDCQDNLYSTGRILAGLRGYSGLVASFSATVFPTNLASSMIKTFGTVAASSIYLENTIETFRLNQEIKIKKEVNSSLKTKYKGNENELELKSVFPNSAKISSAATLLSAGATTLLASPKTFGIRNANIPNVALPAAVTITALSLLFTNRFCNNALRKNLSVYNEDNNKLTQKIPYNINETINENDEQPQDDKQPLLPASNTQHQKQYKTLVPLSNVFQVSATTRGIIGTTLTVSAFFKILTPITMRSLGGSILTLNFLETGLEIYMAHLEGKLLEQEYAALTHSNRLTQ